jgi:hypothetical protein
MTGIVLAAVMRAMECCFAFLRRESCADELTCDRHGAPTTTLRELQITMMILNDARDDAATYLMLFALMIMTMQR